MTDLPDVTMGNPEHKWIARSALQKAIRRGRVDEALKCGGFLFNDNPTYFWKTLATVAIEDVGFANHETVLQVLQHGWSPTQAGWKDRTVMGNLIVDLCQGWKSRAFCELSLWGDKEHKELRDGLRMSPKKLEDAVKFGSMAHRYAALTIIFGKTPESNKQVKGLKMMTHSLLAKEGREGKLKQSEIDLIMLGLNNPFDSMCLAAWPVMEYERTQAWEILERVDWPPEVKLMGVSSAAYDMHTMQGKKAIAAFYTSLSKKFDVVKQIPQDAAVKALGSIIFIVEGGLVDRRIGGDGMDDLKELQDNAFMTAYGVPEPIQAEMLMLVTSEIDRLNQKRQWVLTL